MTDVQAVAAQSPDGFPWITFVFALLLPAVLSWGTTETIKRTFLARWKMQIVTTDEKLASASDSVLAKKWDRERGWWVPLLWFVAVAIGFGVGFVVGLVGAWSALYTGLVGAGGGALSAFLVALLKKQSKRLADAAVGTAIRKLGITDHTQVKGIRAMTDEDLSGGEE